MPIHLYSCGKCSFRLEYLVPKEEPARYCTSCGEREQWMRAFDGQTIGVKVGERGDGNKVSLSGTLVEIVNKAPIFKPAKLIIPKSFFDFLKKQ